MPIAIGQVLSGKYRIEASIGRGGMGEVFAASHLGTGKRVAVKVVSRALLSDVLGQRLHREAVAAGRIQSEFVPQVFDVDMVGEDGGDGELFIVMELLRGEPLSERLKARNGVLTWEEVRAIGDDVLSGLIDAHAAGVVHRDLKPGNIFLEQMVTGGVVTRERARILDFGVAKLDGPDTEKLTTTGESVGTITYMAPEQIRGASKVDERADLYSFGMVVFEAVAGRIPYDAQGQIAIIASKLERNARPLKELAQASVPAGLEALLAKALARKPTERFSTASETLRAWRALGSATTMPRAISATEVGMHLGSPPTATGLTTGTMEPVIAYSSRASRIALLVAAVALVASSVVLAIALRVTPSRSAVTDPPATADTSATVAANAAPTPPATPAPSPPATSTPTDPPALPSTAATPEVTSPPQPVAKPARAWRPRRPPPRANSQGPHLTTEPRY